MMINNEKRKITLFIINFFVLQAHVDSNHEHLIRSEKLYPFNYGPKIVVSTCKFTLNISFSTTTELNHICSPNVALGNYSVHLRNSIYLTLFLGVLSVQNNLKYNHYTSLSVKNYRANCIVIQLYFCGLYGTRTRELHRDRVA